MRKSTTKPRTPDGRYSVLAYGRVSSRGQFEHGHSLETQDRLCREYCDRTFGPGNYRYEYQADGGLSGAYTVRQLARPGEPIRPVLSDVVDRIMAREFTHIVTYEVSRVAREDFLWKCLRHLYCKPAGVNVRIVYGDLDLDNVDDAFVADLMSLTAGRELQVMRQRILDAHESRRCAGYWPTGPLPWGWRWQSPEAVAPGERRNIEPDPERAPYVKLMVQRFLEENRTLPEIARELETTGLKSGTKLTRWPADTVRRIISHPIHTGHMFSKNGELVRGKHYDLRLYDRETYDRVLDKLERRRPIRTRTMADDDFPLLGVLFCGNCGRRLYAHRAGTTNTRFYRCNVVTATDGPPCRGLMKKAEEVEAHVTAAIADFASSPLMQRLVGEEAEALLATHEGELRAELRRVQANLEALDRKLVNWAEAFTTGKLSEVQFTKVSAKWQADHDALSAQHEDLQRRLSLGATNHSLLERVRTALANFATTWERLSPSQQRELLLEMVERLTLGRDGERLVLKLKLRFLPEQEHVLPGFRRARGTGVEYLTDRQLAVLKHLGDGRTLDEIAELFDTARGSVVSCLNDAKLCAGIRDTDELVAAARPYIEAALPRLPLRGRTARRPPGAGQLTPAEERVVELLAQGQSYEQIARALGLAYSTIGVHVHKITRRLNLPNVEAVVEWWETRKGASGP